MMLQPRFPHTGNQQPGYNPGQGVIVGAVTGIADAHKAQELFLPQQWDGQMLVNVQRVEQLQLLRRLQRAGAQGDHRLPPLEHLHPAPQGAGRDTEPLRRPGRQIRPLPPGGGGPVFRRTTGGLVEKYPVGLIEIA